VGLSGAGGEPGTGGGRAEYAAQRKDSWEEHSRWFNELADAAAQAAATAAQALVVGKGARVPQSTLLKRVAAPALKPAKAGKNGRHCRKGKVVQNNPGIHKGDDGAVGKVAFRVCVYGENGMAETAGFPFSLAFSDTGLRPRPAATQQAGCEPAPALAHFVYGQGLLFGPVTPVNTGGLASPACTLECEVLVRERVVARNDEQVCFPSVARAKKAQVGRLPDWSQQEVRVALQRWGDLGLRAEAAAPPQWDVGWIPSAESQAMVRAYWAVGGVPF
jgi:hypothetical protein